MSRVESNDISSLYPPPPPYMKFFTNENLEKLAQNKQEKGSEETKEPSEEVGRTIEETITSELDFLSPPPMPSTHQYRAFGSVWQVKDELPDLETLGITRLYKKSDSDTNGDVPTSYQYKTQELRKLLKSLLLNYLELVGVLSINPELYEPKMENIRTILTNIHHLLNEYRPHQSRESLIMLLEEQLEHKKSEIQHIHEVCRQVQKHLDSIQQSI
ncbi:similar to Saccharomyces cerevisiae YOL135C MED7 Subunit of the RNA polymerase II mediator complex [Maudiozyma barnettii]|uniref:Mediator of RNA polymerase II transcription subunit 7 n=1 Tax=Maudiozyma barnettii TaxID=61262 RepID=A0A8H2VJZ6_9SACH|nr:mediator complex subunit MED7 [Kazachstania barnettii]CAB4256812.1 similar to Saccharomyces cerevisiae YOL135C MED7 Subunit of the RNA polymerase II mediator complex [Kazachstania barnettii]CAD1785465.1 similar to Saccharomyces cerevisiae YOL135C MED7 Subunit of the RNA polymerase II mediator complex [Kazachstania barnettii]